MAHGVALVSPHVCFHVTPSHSHVSDSEEPTYARFGSTSISPPPKITTCFRSASYAIACTMRGLGPQCSWPGPHLCLHDIPSNTQVSESKAKPSPAPPKSTS